MPIPVEPKIYHIVHVDRLPSIIANGCLWSDGEVSRRSSPGTTIGMNGIKQRRLTELTLTSQPGLHVGECVPFYFCPRSIMLYLLYQANHRDLVYQGGQGPIIHLEANLYETVEWATEKCKRWAFTLSNAGAYYFEDRCNLSQLGDIDWDAVNARDWRSCQDGKQAEFLIERRFPWRLVSRIGVKSRQIYDQVMDNLQIAQYQPSVEILPNWYY